MPLARKVPAFAPESFQHWFAKRGRDRRSNGAEVLLWPDTFNNFFHPDVAQAAVEVLETAGCTVTVPRGHFCCGRPLYDFGMLERAQGYLRRVMEGLRGPIEAGMPIVVLGAELRFGVSR